MAGSTVKKGFFFYLLIFLIIIVAFVGVCVTIMLLNPGKSVLGFSYFSGNTTYEVLQTTGEAKQEIKLSQTAYSAIEIDAGMANVVLENNTDHDKNAIYIVNKVKGFSKSSDLKGFSYSATIDGGVLKIKVNVPQGFLYFSKNATVKIHLVSLDDIGTIKDTDLIVKTTSGSVNIGGADKGGYSKPIYSRSLDITTESGNISLSSETTNNFKNISLKTKSGTVDLTKQEGLKASNADINIDIGDGKLKTKIIDDNVNLKAVKGIVTVGEIKGKLDISVDTTIVDIEKISGDVNFAEGSEIMSACKVDIEEIGGLLNIPQGKDSNINVKKVVGKINVNIKNGNVLLGDEKNPISANTFVKSEGGEIEVYFANNLEWKQIISESGKVTANFKDGANGQLDITSKNGNVFINFKATSRIQFNFNIPNPDDKNEFKLSNVKFDIFNGKELTENPYNYEVSESEGRAIINAITNKTITLDII